MINFKINNKRFVKIDDDDLERVQKHKWIAGKYPKISKTTISMHRFIMNAKPGELVDHRNRDVWDCQKSNLRICNHHQNNSNVKPRTGLPYKGVRKSSPNRFIAYIYKDSKRTILGYFSDIEEAAKVYDKAAKKQYGEFAYLNFP